MREMKNSGLKWIGEIPYSWNVMPNKYLMKKKKVICPVYKGEDILSLTMKRSYSSGFRCRRKDANVV